MAVARQIKMTDEQTTEKQFRGGLIQRVPQGVGLGVEGSCRL